MEMILKKIRDGLVSRREKSMTYLQDDMQQLRRCNFGTESLGFGKKWNGDDTKEDFTPETVASRRNTHTYHLILCLPEKAGYKMAELIVCFVVDKLIQLLITTEANLSRNARTEVGFIKDELESIRSFLKEVDAMAAAAVGETANDGVKTWVNQVREAAFYVEDVIDEYLLRSIRHHQHHGFVRFFHKIIRLAKTMRSQDGIVSKVDRIKELVREKRKIWIQIH
ncbi:hypothetical protein DVH24_022672 [Malus domestica]|uniref:Disease resistance N-terminal domain-containing protein n=1 Tax=Malus domestica TaxID=3750 RepID=A0A498KLC2_MALDO|nr:hypothetical protein DVH24_022672 [Malus domestica]